MATYIFDDGSTISNEQTPTGWVTTSTAATDNGIVGWTQDQAEAAKYGQFYSGEKPWYEQLAMFGVTRAIDAHFKNSTVDKTAQPAYYAGQNGQTYAAGTGGLGVLGNPLVLLLIAGVALYAIAD